MVMNVSQVAAMMGRFISRECVELPIHGESWSMVICAAFGGNVGTLVEMLEASSCPGSAAECHRESKLSPMMAAALGGSLLCMQLLHDRGGSTWGGVSK